MKLRDRLKQQSRCACLQSLYRTSGESRLHEHTASQWPRSLGQCGSIRAEGRAQMEGKFQKNLEVIVDGVGEAGGEVSWMNESCIQEWCQVLPGAS